MSDSDAIKTPAHDTLTLAVSKAMWNAHGDCGPVVSLNRRDGCSSRWRLAGHKPAPDSLRSLLSSFLTPGLPFAGVRMVRARDR